MNLTTTLSVIILFINLFLGSFVFLKNRTSKINRIFFFLTLGVSLWITGLLFIGEGTVKTNPLFPLYGLRIAFAAASILAFLFIYFSLEFPKKDREVSLFWKILATFITAFFVFAALFSDLIVVRIKEIQDWRYAAEYGALYRLFGLYFIGFMIFGIVNLARKLKKFSGVEKIQIKYILAGSTLSIIFTTTTNLILPMATGISAYAKFGPLGTIFLVALTFYAILKHHLMNVRVIATELFSAVIVFIFLVQLTLTRSFPEFVIGLFLFILVVTFSYFLIRGTIREVNTLKRLSRAKSEFISIASHQLRTPLAAMKGYLSMLKEGSFGQINEKVNGVLDRIFQNNERLIRLIEELLDISKIEEGRLEFAFQEMDVSEAIQSVIEELSPLVLKKNLNILWERPKESLIIKADPAKFRQVILNLVDNGIKYTNDGYVAIKLKAQSPKPKTDKETFIIEIKDTGVGMTKEEISRLFERFHRGEEISQVHPEGVGLGLYVAKKIVEAHNGRIWAESEGKGKGSTFFVELPI